MGRKSNHRRPFPMEPVVVRALGHPNIKASHEKTIELTADRTVSGSGTCIVGIETERPMESLLKLRGDVAITLRCGDVEDVLEARVNPTFIHSDPLILRRHPDPQIHSFCIGASKGSAGLKRDLVEALRQPESVLEMIVEPVRTAAVPEGALFVVGTPIGNLEDLSPRAIATLESVDVIVAEDTRSLRAQVGSASGQLLSLHDHNERARTPQILDKLASGCRVALVSEAGMPLISDPGFYLVRSAAEAGHLVTPVPGPDAITASISVAGLPADDIRFVGFLPRKTGERAAVLDMLKRAEHTTVFYEAPHRLTEILELIDGSLGPRQLAVCRNLTKPGETVTRGCAAEILERLRADDQVRGEYAVVVDRAPPAEDETLDPRLLDMVESLVEAGVPTSAISTALARASGRSRREAFAIAVEAKNRLVSDDDGARK